MSTEVHTGVGEGTVLLDIGGDIGALVVSTSVALDGAEIEIVPTGATPHADPDSWSHGHDHADDPAAGAAGTGLAGSVGHHHPPGHPPHLLHVGVHRRPGPGGSRWAAVFPELHAGTYDLRLRPDGPVRLSVPVTGGQVTEAVWPDHPR